MCESVGRPANRSEDRHIDRITSVAHQAAELILCRQTFCDDGQGDYVSDKQPPTAPAPKAPAPSSTQRISELVTRALSSTSTIVENYSAAIEAKPAAKS
jgi:hypothetical protein